ncbi:MAG: geranyl transferase [Sutterella sp. 54_7]|nr:MAG: geranyl transferase [Sutterella sp. 54_7]
MSTIPTTSAAELEFQLWMKERVSHFEWFAEKMLPQTGIGAKRLVGAMRYSLLGGGKRIRPLLCYAAGAVSGAPEEVLDRAALALEMIHSYSPLRRGRATTHVRYGEAMAMLAGDALQTEAFTVLSSPSVPPEAAQRLVQTLARAAGVWGMCGGQALDLEMVGQKPGAAELSRMQAMKTGAMIMAAVLMGAQSGIWTALGDQAKAGLAAYADALGVAFQVVDDILDCTQDTMTLGKTAGKDAKDDKPTWVSLLGLDGAKARAKALEEDAEKALQLLAADPAVPAGAEARLREIALYVVRRTH